MLTIFSLSFLCFLKFIFFPKHYKYVIVPGASYDNWSFSNKGGDKKRLRLSYRKKLVILKWTNSNFDVAVLKIIFGLKC